MVSYLGSMTCIGFKCAIEAWPLGHKPNHVERRVHYLMNASTASKMLALGYTTFCNGHCTEKKVEILIQGGHYFYNPSKKTGVYVGKREKDTVLWFRNMWQLKANVDPIFEWKLTQSCSFPEFKMHEGVCITESKVEKSPLPPLESFYLDDHEWPPLKSR